MRVHSNFFQNFYSPHSSFAWAYEIGLWSGRAETLLWSLRVVIEWINRNATDLKPQNGAIEPMELKDWGYLLEVDEAIAHETALLKYPFDPPRRNQDPPTLQLPT